MGSYEWFDLTIDGQSYSTDCRFGTCSCWEGYTIVKRIGKAPALFLLVLLAGYIGYLVMTEQELPEELQKGKTFIEEIAHKEDEKVKEQNLLINRYPYKCLGKMYSGLPIQAGYPSTRAASLGYMFEGKYWKLSLD